MPKSLRTRLILGVALGMALLLGVSCFAIDELLRRAMLSTVDESLVSTARLLVPLVEYDDGVIDLDVGKLPEAGRGKSENLVQVWVEDGKTVARSSELEGHDLPMFGGTPQTPEIRELRLPNGAPGRVVGIVFTVSPSSNPEAHPPRTVTLVVARSTDELQSQLATIRQVLIGAFATIIVVSVFIVVVTVSEGLRPLHALGAQIERVDDSHLHLRFDLAALPTELEPIAERLNLLLTRLQAAFERERGFTADVAHELRTPLAGVRTITDVALARPHDAEDYRQSLAEVREIGLSMTTMVERLLTLARLDNGQIDIVPVDVTMRAAIDVAWALFEDRAKARNLVFENLLPDELSCRIDPALLTIILGNLFDNSVEYSNQGGLVRVAGTATDGWLEMTVENTGCEMAPEDVAKVFQRFWRGDSSRPVGGNHSGLGLAMVKRATVMSGGTITITTTSDRVFVVCLKLPDEKQR